MNNNIKNLKKTKEEKLALYTAEYAEKINHSKKQVYFFFGARFAY